MKNILVPNQENLSGILSVMLCNDQWRLRSGSDAQCLIKGGRDPVVCMSERKAL